MVVFEIIADMGCGLTDYHQLPYNSVDSHFFRLEPGVVNVFEILKNGFYCIVNMV